MKMLINDLDKTISDIKLLYIGSVLPDLAEFKTSAFSPAGSFYQCNILCGMKRAGLEPDLIISFRALQSYPKSKSIFIRKSKSCLKNGMKVNLLSYINITPIKQLSLGLSCFFEIVAWGWRNRALKRKVVYTYNLSVPPGLFTLLGTRLIGAKAVASLNDINVPGQTVPNNLFNKIDFYLHKKLIPRFDGHIVVSHEIMADFCPNRPYLLIEGGISSATIESGGDDKAANQSNSMHFHIVSVGTLYEVNGINVLLQAFSLLNDNNYRLSIAGSGPLTEYVIDAAKSDSRITYHGLLPTADVLSLYTKADVLVNMRITKYLNTKYFYPSKMMEYLASGTPVITTCTGHTKEEFGAFVYLLEDETPMGLASLISFVRSQNPYVRKQIGVSAKNYMMTHKTWEIQGSKIAGYLVSLF